MSNELPDTDFFLTFQKHIKYRSKCKLKSLALPFYSQKAKQEIYTPLSHVTVPERSKQNREDGVEVM
jgi:hypothetical protein